MRFFWAREHIRSSLWFIPTLCVIASFIVATALVQVDQRINGGWIEQVTFKGDAENARTFLATISSSMITFTGLVFTITIVVLQLASQQLSPRVLRTFLRDRQSQLSLGIFVGTFTYSMLVLRELRSATKGASEFVPNISISVGFGFVLLSIGFFVAYIHHIAQAIRIGNLAEAIAAETGEAIRNIYDDASVPERVEAPQDDPVQVVEAPKRGIVAALDRDALVAVAERHDAVVEVVPSVGDFVSTGSVLLRVYRNEIPTEATEHVAQSTERTMAQDPAFGFRQLVDIGQKALSPGINDPTTAVQAIDMIHDLLRQLVTRPFPVGQRCDEAGNLRLIFPVMTWEAYVHLSCDELRHYGSSSLQVIRRLRDMLHDLLTVAPDERRPVLEEKLELLDDLLEREWPDVEDRDRGREADAQGLGD